MRRFHVVSKSENYEVVVGRGAWRALRQFPVGQYSSVLVLTEKPLWNRWGKLFFREAGLEKVRVVFVQPGEGSKSIQCVERVALQLLEHRADRHSLLIAFGGGVVGDLSGFVASTYMRGIDCVQVPTTIVAQVDSAIGGKTGVNAGVMKNLIGTFYPPRLVLADPNVLASLSPRAFRSGLYEVVKHGILAGAPLFNQLEGTLKELRPEETETLEPILESAVKVKIDVVSRDERESGLRRVLNLGHTFGHALEEATHYRRFLHGEAVGWGLLAVTHLARRLGLLDSDRREEADGERIIRLVRQVGPLPRVSDLEPARVVRLLRRDKKAVGGRIHWIIPEGIGRVRTVADVPLATAGAAFREVQRTYTWSQAS